MAPDTFFVLLGSLLLLAFAAESAFTRLRIPPVVVLVAVGLLLGPVTGLLPANRFVEVAPHFGALAFLLILFEGGLDLSVAVVLTRFRAGLLLAGVGLLVAVAIGTAVALAARFPPVEALALAVALAPISGSIVLPLVGNLGLRTELQTTLVLEAALADVLAVLAMGLLVRLETGGGAAGLVALGSLLAAVFSVVAALAAGLLWPRLLRRLGDRRHLDALTLGVAMALWGFADGIGASGALAVLVFGITLANEGRLLDLLGLPFGEVVAVANETVVSLHRFIGQLTFVVRAFFFVFLGVVVSFAQLPVSHYAVAAAVVALLLPGRWAAIAWLESRGLLLLSRAERLPLVMLQPRGLVSAVLAIEAGHAGLAGGGSFLGIVSLVLLATNLLLIPAALRLRPAANAAAPSAADENQH